MVSNTTPSKSYERLIDGKTTPDFEYFNQVLPPELARQIMMGKLALESFFDLSARDPGLSLCHYISTLVILLPNCDLNS